MKKAFRFLLLVAVVLLTAGCFSSRKGSSSTTPTVTQAPDAALLFVANSSYKIDVTVDRNQYHVKTVKSQDLDRKRNLKQAADNMIYVSPGSHQVTIRERGKIVYDQRVHVRSDETKMIKL